MPYDPFSLIYVPNLKLIDWSNNYAADLVNIAFIKIDNTLPALRESKFLSGFENGEFLNTPPSQALDIIMNTIQHNGFINDNDNIIDVFFQINRNSDFNDLGEFGKVYIRLKSEF